jgi:hypothetical protein
MIIFHWTLRGLSGPPGDAVRQRISGAGPNLLRKSFHLYGGCGEWRHRVRGSRASARSSSEARTAAGAAARKEEVMTLEQPAEIMLSLLQEKSSHIWRAVSLSSGAASGDKAQQHVGGQPGQVQGLGEAGDGIGTDLAA